MKIPFKIRVRRRDVLLWEIRIERKLPLRYDSPSLSIGSQLDAYKLDYDGHAIEIYQESIREVSHLYTLGFLSRKELKRARKRIHQRMCGHLKAFNYGKFKSKDFDPVV